MPKSNKEMRQPREINQWSQNMDRRNTTFIERIIGNKEIRQVTGCQGSDQGQGLQFQEVQHRNTKGR